MPEEMRKLIYEKFFEASFEASKDGAETLFSFIVEDNQTAKIMSTAFLKVFNDTYKACLAKIDGSFLGDRRVGDGVGANWGVSNKMIALSFFLRQSSFAEYVPLGDEARKSLTTDKIAFVKGVKATPVEVFESKETLDKIILSLGFGEAEVSIDTVRSKLDDIVGRYSILDHSIRQVMDLQIQNLIILAAYYETYGSYDSLMTNWRTGVVTDQDQAAAAATTAGGGDVQPPVALTPVEEPLPTRLEEVTDGVEGGHPVAADVEETASESSIQFDLFDEEGLNTSAMVVAGHA